MAYSKLLNIYYVNESTMVDILKQVFIKWLHYNIVMMDYYYLFDCRNE